MKRILLLPVALIFFIASVHAQIGWRWLSGCSGHNVPGAFTAMEGWGSATDGQGNVYGTIVCYGYDTLHFGSVTVPNLVYNRLQIIFTKADSGGHYLWAQAIPDTSVSLKDIAADRNGNLYVLFYYYAPSLTWGGITLTADSSHAMYALAKLSSSGNLLWLQNIGRRCNLAATSGLALTDMAGTIKTDMAGNVYVATNFFEDSIRIGANTLYKQDVRIPSNPFIAKFNTSGAVQWVRQISGEEVYLTGMAVSRYGTIYVTGTYAFTITCGGLSLTAPATITAQLPYLLKLDTGGNGEWGRNAGDGSLVYTAIATDNNEAIYLTTHFSREINYNGALFSPVNNADNLLLIAMDSAAVNVWAKALYADTGYHIYNDDISVDDCGNILVSGSLLNDTSLLRSGPPGYIFSGADTFLMPGPPNPDPMYVAMWDYTGRLIMCNILNSGGDDNVYTTFGTYGDIYVCGDYIGSIRVNADTLSTQAIESFFLAAYHYSDTICESEPYLVNAVRQLSSTQQNIKLYPDPAHFVLTVESTVPVSSVTIMNMLGQSMYSEHRQPGNKAVIDVAAYPPGVYLIRVNNGEVRRWVKE